MSLAKESGLYLSVGLDDSPFQKDMKAFMLTAQRAGDTASKAFDGAFTPNKISSSFTNLAKSINTASAAARHLNTSIKVSGLDALAKSAGLSASGLDKMYEAAIKVARDSSLERAFANIQKQTGMSTLGMAKFRYELGDTSGALSTLWSGAKSAAIPILGVGAAALYAGKACLDATVQMDRLNKSYQSIEGSAGLAQEKLDFVYKTSQELGLSFVSTAESAKIFFAAAKGTTLEKDMDRIFKSVSQAGTALSLSTEQMGGVFLAFTQIISKGRVQQEEILQIAERFPGTYQMVADALGKSTTELVDFIAKGNVTANDLLPKLADQFENKFAVAAENAANGIQQSINKMDNEWTVFKSNLLESEPIVSAINMITGALQGLNAAMGERYLEKRMESAGWQRTEVTDFRKSTYKLYTEEQKKIFLEYEKILREQEKAEADVTINQKKEIDERLKASSAATAAYEKIFSTTKEGQKKAAQDAYTTAEALQKSALDKGAITQAEYDKRITALAQARDEKITAINKRGAKTRLSEAEKEAKKFTEATAQYEAGLKKLRNEVGAMEDALDPSLTKFERLRKQIEAEKKAAIENADVKAKETVRRKQATVAQAQETAELEKRKAVLTATQKLDELENQNLRDKADFYKDLAEKTGRYSTSMEYQNQLLEKQREIWLSMGIPGKDVQEMIRQLQLESSRDPFDGITRGLQGFISEATDGAKAMEDTFSGLFNGMDSGFHSVWEQMLEDGKVSLSSFKSLFASFLADLMHMAITRPITVQIAGVVSGMLGTGGVAYAAGGSGGGGIGNLSGVSNLMPGSWTSGIADTINNTMAGWFPSTFASTSAVSSAANAGVMSATGGAADVAGLKAAEAASSLGGNTTFLSTVSPYLMAGGLGSLGYTMLGGALGLPQSKYSGLTAGLSGAAGWGLGSLAAGSFASIGATMGSVVPVVGTIIGALAGGALGSLFGQQRKTHPSVYGHMIGLGYTTDTQTYIDAFMNQATYDRAGKQEASGYAQVIGEAASQTAGNILDLAAMLPEAYKQSVEEQLASATWSAGRGYSGASWNLQNWKEGMAEERIQEAIDDMFEQMGYGANKAFAEAGIGELFDSFDLSTEEGFKKAQTAISAISSITTAIDQIKTPTTEAEQQAKAFVEQMNALGEAVKASGLNAAYADEMLGEYRTAYVDKYVETLEEMFNPLSQIEQQAKGYKTAIDGYVAALTTMQASEEQLAQVRGYTQDAIDSITGSLDAAFFPLSDVEQQTKATMESLLAYKAALETLGASTEELTRIDAAWGKMQSDLLDKARDYVRTTPQIVSQSAAMNAEFDALREAMLLAGNATADLTELERTRAQAVAAMQAQYAESFRQTYAQRYATLTGDTNGLAVLQQQASFSSELAEIEKTWGKDSLQYKQMQALQEAEAAKLRLEQAQADADRLAQLRLEREKLVMQTSVDSSKARLDALKAEKSAAEKLKSTWEDVLATIYKTRLNMYQSDDNLDLFGRLATAQGEFDRLYGLAIGGDAEAAKEMASVSSGLLDLRKETSATSAEYLDAFYGVDKKLKDVSGIASKQVSAADRQLAALGSQLSVQEAQYGVLSAQLSALGSQNATLASIDAQIAGLKGVLSGLDSAKGDYQSALDKGNEIKPNTGVYGSNYLTEYDLMAAKVASLNRGEYIDPNFGIPAGGWTIANARQAMLDTYGSVPEWYKNAGKIEGFAKGGLASGWGIAGEYGPELIDFSTPGRVYTAEQTRQILMPPAVGTDGSLVAEIAKLREQNKEMARELRIANARLEKMEKYAKETKDGVDEIRVVGIPVTVEA